LRPFKIKFIPLKTKVLPLFLYTTITLLFMSFSDPYTIKRISDANFRYEFYTTSKTIKPKENKIYYWFKGGLIHNTQSGMTGELLQDKFVKMYHSNQLAEQGTFKKGLKTGLWKTWYPSGVLETTQKWSNGLQTGTFFRFNENGLVIEKGNFKKGKKHGVWIDYIKKDTVVYKRGVVFVKEIKPSKVEKAKIKEEKQKIKSVKKEARIKKRTSKKLETTSETEPKKEGFFKRLFGKKQPKENANG
jgi:antitoxin component YwqK of YwqJK toxin-antitoxin module